MSLFFITRKCAALMITRFRPTRERNSLWGKKKRIKNRLQIESHQSKLEKCWKWSIKDDISLITLREFLRSLNIFQSVSADQICNLFYSETCFHSRWRQPLWRCPWWHHGAETSLCCAWHRWGGSSLKGDNVLPIPHAAREPPPSCRVFQPLYRKKK